MYILIFFSVLLAVIGLGRPYAMASSILNSTTTLLNNTTTTTTTMISPSAAAVNPVNPDSIDLVNPVNPDSIDLVKLDQDLGIDFNSLVTSTTNQPENPYHSVPRINPPTQSDVISSTKYLLDQLDHNHPAADAAAGDLIGDLTGDLNIGDLNIGDLNMPAAVDPSLDSNNDLLFGQNDFDLSSFGDLSDLRSELSDLGDFGDLSNDLPGKLGQFIYCMRPSTLPPTICNF
jgi:hypothetical protein